ncbi:hypothetical protein BCF33_1253 [Hasllibacter halocynthiae]|uniref:YnbE-like lipoprotein n=1 Tax=Hasllibacter halocynthiae TaxID=595589 RepID=A0A2T0X9K3_9RHOB|nr:hypothetical protein [Hasllibacter halocynthiae]PRY95631.1 hypothetical protein BCF33_1253 [Hasllibacter halocynthiae]
MRIPILLLPILLAACASGPFASGPGGGGSGGGGPEAKARLLIDVENLDLHLRRARIELEVDVEQLARILQAARG